ncbi:protein FAM205C isoform X2 [Cervus elaphus]|uniref:protein FAM205C isoform X2 n=1 Tax=Cervus canadensis TaxID=1574408 RepID=UPI001C9E7EA6|nr:protein FAM205C isoform X2 [Cervus canadensis]XP_043747006.1 protein FAM205C isoform X2 [Cervus elaphus]
MMLSPTFILWDVGYPFYTYGSIIIIALIIWQVKKKHQDLKLQPNRNCCRRHQKVKQRTKEKTPRARRHSRKEADKPWELLSIMRSRGWLPQEGSVRRLLCADPCCQTCNSVALEIQQLISGETTLTTPTSSGPSQGSSCLEVLSMSSLSFDQSQDSLPFKQLSLPSATRTVSRLTTQKSVTQSAAKSATKPAAKSASAISIRQYWAGHQQLRQECRGPELPLDAGALSSSSLEEPRIPVNQHVKKKSNSEGILKKQAVEADLRNKLKHFTDWINPNTKDQGHKECILRCKNEKVAKTKTKKAEKSPPPTRRPMKGAKLEKEEGFFDALQCLDSEFQRQSVQSVQSGQSCFLPLSSGSSKRSPLLTHATQPENPSQVSMCTSAEGTRLPQESTQSRKKELRGSQTSASS